MHYFILLTGLLAFLPAIRFFRNLKDYRPPPTPTIPPDSKEPPPAVSVLIPARNEAGNIAAAVKSVLANRGVELEVLVMDDHSTDDTAAIVCNLQKKDPRVRLLNAPPLPEGWCGKQHACHALARHATHSVLCFIDADVRLAPDALARLVALMQTGATHLISGVPRQITNTFWEKLLIPLIHFLLLAFLPIQRMRRSLHPSYGAGCGQLFVADADAYWKSGGHATIRDSLHDGLQLPRAFRKAGLKTDLCDATPLAVCRMYSSRKDLFQGLMKNATEGLAKPALILPATVLLLGGQVLPWLWLPLVPVLPWCCQVATVTAVTCSFSVRWAAARRFQQPLSSALLHPLGILTLLLLQWIALARRIFGGASSWKGRSYPQIAGMKALSNR